MCRSADQAPEWANAFEFAPKHFSQVPKPACVRPLGPLGQRLCRRAVSYISSSSSCFPATLSLCTSGRRTSEARRRASIVNCSVRSKARRQFNMAARVASAQHPLLSHLPAPVREHVAPVAPERVSAAPTLTKEPPPYGTPERRAYLPRRNDDFGGGGAFPEASLRYSSAHPHDCPPAADNQFPINSPVDCSASAQATR